MMPFASLQRLYPLLSDQTLDFLFLYRLLKPNRAKVNVTQTYPFRPPAPSAGFPISLEVSARTVAQVKNKTKPWELSLFSLFWSNQSLSSVCVCVEG